MAAVECHFIKEFSRVGIVQVGLSIIGLDLREKFFVNRILPALVALQDIGIRDGVVTRVVIL